MKIPELENFYDGKIIEYVINLFDGIQLLKYHNEPEKENCLGVIHLAVICQNEKIFVYDYKYGKNYQWIPIGYTDEELIERIIREKNIYSIEEYLKILKEQNNSDEDIKYMKEKIINNFPKYFQQPENILIV